MTWLKQKLEGISPKKVIIGLFILMFVIELIFDLVTAGLLIGVLLMLYGLYILKRKDYINLKLMFLLLLVIAVLKLVMRVFDKLI